MHPVRLHGVEQLIFVGGDGMSGFDPTTGQQFWHFDWDMGQGFNRCTQPTLVGESDLLIGSGFGQGTKRVRITRSGNGWKAEEVWATRAISPYFNDLVVYQDHAYGFDTNGFLTCVDLAKGQRKWKVRGYDNGQVLLLADAGLLLVQCEKGDVALVAARPDQHQELARMKGLDSKTWNHPVIANGKLFIRNDRTAAAFELAGK
jgi:outer membrane protein assembly factor BamB